MGLPLRSEFPSKNTLLQYFSTSVGMGTVVQPEGAPGKALSPSSKSRKENSWHRENVRITYFSPSFLCPPLRAPAPKQSCGGSGGDWSLRGPKIWKVESLPLHIQWSYGYTQNELALSLYSCGSASDADTVADVHSRAGEGSPAFLARKPKWWAPGTGSIKEIMEREDFGGKKWFCKVIYECMGSGLTSHVWMLMGGTDSIHQTEDFEI